MLLNVADEGVTGDEGTVAKCRAPPLLLVLVSEALALALPTVDANELAVELLGTLHASWLLQLVLVLMRGGGSTRRVGVVVVVVAFVPDAVCFRIYNKQMKRDYQIQFQYK